MRNKYQEIESIKKFIPTRRLVADRYLIKMLIREDVITLEYIAFDREKERNVALRILPGKYFNNRYAVKTIKKEAELALLLEHDHIAQLYSFEKWKYFYFTTAEYIPGATLSQYLLEKGGRLPFEEVVKLLRPVAKAIDFAHGRSPEVIHGDIRPETIIFQDNKIIKLMDFGVSRVESEIAIHRSSKKIRDAVLAYKAPEQIEKEGLTASGTDVYALAAVAYELISGNTCFRTREVNKKVKGEEDIPRIVGVPDSTNNALSYGLAKNIDNRPDNALEFVSILADDPYLYSLKEKIIEPEEEQKEPVEEEKIKKTPFFFYTVLCSILIFALAFGWFYVRKMNYQGILPAETKEKDVPHKIPGEVRNTESKPSESTIEIKKRKNIKPPLGDLHIESKPSGALVYLDGMEQGNTPLRLFSLEKGMYNLTITKKGYRNFTKSVNISPLEINDLSVTLKKSFGSISIISKPEGALVFINGKRSGSTPLDMKKMKEGRYDVVIKKTDYADWKKEVVVKPEELVTLSAEMDITYGSLHITSKPPGAHVYIEGEKRADTPVTLENVKEGSINVRVEKECYNSMAKNVRIRAKKISETEFILTSICGSLSVKSRPTAAQWYLNGVYVGTTPATIEDIEAGRHHIKVTSPDRIDWLQTIDVRGGKREIVEAELEPTPPQPGEEMIDPTTRMEFVRIGEGCFKMGAEEDELGRGADESPYHEVCLERGFWIGKYEVMQGQWNRVMEDNPSFFSKDDDYPVESVSWNDVRLFIEKINLMNKDNKIVYRLPTEAEWEYACKGGKKQTIISDEVIGTGAVAWFARNSKRTPYPTGWKAPNNFQLYDMLGNVYEWVEDVYDEDAYQKHSKMNPVVRGDSELRVTRGGSWYHSENDCRCANRHYYKADSGNYYTGFRLVKDRSGQ